MKTKVTIVIMCSIFLLVTGLGCITMSHWLTPAKIDKAAVEYVVEAGIAEPNKFVGYANLSKAEKLQDDVDIAHSTIQFDLQQLIEKDNFEHAVHSGTTGANVAASLQIEQQLFGPEGLLSLGLSLVGVGGLTGFLGLMRKRPGDVTENELQQALADATGQTIDELSEKEKQFIQLVKGIQEFMEFCQSANPEIATALKNILNKHEDASTKVAVVATKESFGK